jgi:glutamyl-tRNA reductase
VLSVVGVSHQTTPVELRVRITFGESELPDALKTLGHGVILSTCNRTEVYSTDDWHSIDQAIGPFLSSRLNEGSDALAPHLYVLHGESAVRHLFAVASGLDSLVLGESQILGQVRHAIDIAQATGTAGPVLVRAFGEALRVGRRARTETFIGRHAVSVSYAAVQLARQIFGQLAGCRVLVVGAGEMGELTTRTLVSQGVGSLAVVNRSLAHAETLAARFGGRAMSFDNLVPALRESDIVISSTDAPGYVISRSAAAEAIAERSDRPLFLIDIAVPRDVDPDVRSLPNVHLYNIDDLRALCDYNRQARQGELQQVQSIINEETARFASWWRIRAAVPTIRALRDRAEQIRQAELTEALAGLRHLDENDRQIVDALTRAIVNKLLHQPTVHLKSSTGAGDETVIASVWDLFGLQPG